MKIVARTQNLLSSQDESPLKCCVTKSATQISTQLSDTQVSGDFRFERHSCYSPSELTALKRLASLIETCFPGQSYVYTRIPVQAEGAARTEKLGH